MSDDALIAAADLAAVKRLRARIAALEAERDAIIFAAHMPDDYEYGLPTWINQRLYMCYIGAELSPAVQERFTRLVAERDAALAAIHTRNNQFAAAQFSLELAYDDIKRAIALLPQEPGAALGVLVSALHAQNAPQTAQAGSGGAIAPQASHRTGWPGTPEERAP